MQLLDSRAWVDGRSRRRCASQPSASRRARHRMLMILVTVPGKPLNGGTLACFMAAAMQAPLEVPEKGGSLTVALAALPLGSKVTMTVALPVGPPFSRHLAVSKAAALSAALAASGSKCCDGSPGLFLPSAWRAPLANNSAKPALGVVAGWPLGGSNAALEPGLAPPGFSAVSVGTGASAVAGGVTVGGRAAGSALIGVAGGSLSSEDRIRKKIPAPIASSTTMPMISGARLFLCGQLGMPDA